MKHAVTRTLYDYWSRLRGDRIAPERFEVEPADIRHILGDTFIIEAQDRQSYPFRLAGTRLCAAYCRELKGRNLLDLWTGKDREAVACMLAAVVEDGAAAVIGLDAQNERGQSMPVEIMLLPLKHDGPYHSRLLGCYVPLDSPYWLGLHPVIRQPIHSLRLVWPDERPTFLMTKAQADLVVPEPPVLAAGDIEARPVRRPVGGRPMLRVIEGGRR